eukprot:209787_1
MKLALQLCCSMVIAALLSGEAIAKHSGHHHHVSASKGYRHRRHFTDDQGALFDTRKAAKHSDGKGDWFDVEKTAEHSSVHTETIVVGVAISVICLAICLCMMKCMGNDEDVMDIVNGNGLHKLARSPDTNHKECVWDYYHKNPHKTPTAAEKVVWAQFHSDPESYQHTEIDD